MPTVSMRELTQLDSGKSTMRYLPPKDTAGFAVFCVSAYKREPRPAGKDHCHDFFCHNFILPLLLLRPRRSGAKINLLEPGRPPRRVCGPPYSSAGFSALGLRPRLAGAFFSAFSAFSALSPWRRRLFPPWTWWSGGPWWSFSHRRPCGWRSFWRWSWSLPCPRRPWAWRRGARAPRSRRRSAAAG